MRLPGTLWDNSKPVTSAALGAPDAPLTAIDVSQLNQGARRVYDLLFDGRWHDRDEIERAAGERGVAAAEGMRRMRELRQRGFKIEKHRTSDRRVWLYRMVVTQ